MTDNATIREKGRAVVLAALMVFSVVAMSAAFAGGAAAAQDSYGDDGDVNDGNTQLNNSDRLFQGQVGYVLNDSVGVSTDLSNASTVELHDEDGNWVRDLDVKKAGADHDFVAEDELYIEVSTEILDGSSYNVTDEDEVNVQFDVSTHTLTSEFTDDSVTNANSGTSTELSIDSERSGITTEVSAEGLDHKDLWSIFGDGSTLDDGNVTAAEGVAYVDAEEDSIVLEGREDFNADFDGIEAGEYEFTASVTDTTAEDTATIQVSEIDEDYYFSNVESVSEGEIAEITLGLEGADTASVVLGEDDTFAAAVTVNDVSGDEITLEYNTYNNEWDIADDDSDAYLTNEKTNDALDNGNDSLPAWNWDLTLGQGLDTQNFTLNEEHDRDVLTVSDYAGVGDTTSYTAPADAGIHGDYEAYDEATVTETDTFAVEDGIVVALEDFGADGAVAANGSDLLDKEGVNIDVAEQTSGPINNAENWSTNAGDLDAELITTDLDSYDGDLLVTLDPAGNASFAADQSYDVTVTIDAETSSFMDADEDDDYEQEFEISFEDRELSWDEIDSLPAEDGATASGTTTVAPGTDLSANADSPSDEGGFVDYTSAVVNDDYTFDAEFDLAGETPGVHFDLTANEDTSVASPADAAVLEDVQLTAADEPEPETDVDVSAEYDSPITTEESTDISAVVTNNGDTAQTVDVELTFNGETYTEEGVEVGANSSETVTLTTVNGEDLDASDYDLTISVSNENVDASADGTLTVEDASENGAENGAENGDENGAENGDENGTENGNENGAENGNENGDENGNENGNENGGEDDGEDDGTPGFGIAVALVAMLAAAMLALRRQN
ncbi:PGF-CTERM sorting domain-containing protein [Haloterrigena sp. SYSU A558-1]|uniref:PGF-CTERM sorting domain-containing protein n=1 Tax=Haloterrigena gelatinilytica TaxID=2741724 RepID=A0ABX2L6Q8_9EURY|nr:BGTF surface domain-containing protein [Haloterrigena gelatinilytica]NUC71396.1 PGF-CTERM sorting domain-containing protein [Haloterrigena gelatinilytica]